MKLRRDIAALLLACIASAGIPIPVLAQVQATHEVRLGDTLFAIARKTRYDGVNRNQMILAIWRANQQAFPGGNIQVLEVGTVLVIPPRDEVAAVASAEADRLVREMLAAAPAPAAQVAAARPPAPAATTPTKPASVAARDPGPRPPLPGRPRLGTQG